MKFADVERCVRGVPFIVEPNARYLYDLVIREKLTRVLELGIAHGTASCYIAAALDENGGGRLTSVDLTEAAAVFDPSPETQLARTGLARYVDIVRMQTGYTWFLHDEIQRLTAADRCEPEYDLCIVDGPKNWTIDGCAFFLVDKLLKPGGRIIFDDYLWTYADDDARQATDGITHRGLSEAERTTPHIREVFELLVKQHPAYGELSVDPAYGWAIARKSDAARKTYTIEYRETNADVLVALKHRLRKLVRSVAG